MHRRSILAFVIVFVCLSACGRRQDIPSYAEPDSDVVALAVAATLTALPTATPYIIEVTSAPTGCTYWKSNNSATSRTTTSRITYCTNDYSTNHPRNGCSC